ncbi:Grifin DrGRIFIN [Triplophysa tibetana]|uniref:Galectin n=1 Tax=Triplophysa tibetana TaxID=1572043 RepID=A0A5A9N8Z0_9TELE|nr:Grifin DrGRIFIN [Triplophysa tibetana]
MTIRVRKTPFDELQTESGQFEASCHDGLCPGWSFILKGETQAKADKFEINFLCDRDDRIAFHFNPRFTESDIICNSFIANHWGKEERCSNFPFGIEEPFQIEIWSDNEHFHVYIDDTKIMQYKHRVEDLKTITKVQVVHDVNISSLEIAKKHHY